MSIYFGNNNIDQLQFGNLKIKEAYYGNIKVYPNGLPSPGFHTMRFKFSDTTFTPITGVTTYRGSWQPVNENEGIWDWYYGPQSESHLDTKIGSIFQSRLIPSVIGEGNYVDVIECGDFSDITEADRLFHGCTLLRSIAYLNTFLVEQWWQAFRGCTNLITVEGIETGSARVLEGMFDGCTYLLNLPASFDLSSATDIGNMFHGVGMEYSPSLLNTSNVELCNSLFSQCWRLKEIPLFDTSSVESCSQLCYYSDIVERGALNLYNRLSTQSNPPLYYSDAFLGCGINTASGLAELEQIPSSWGGLA